MTDRAKALIQYDAETRSALQKVRSLRSEITSLNQQIAAGRQVPIGQQARLGRELESGIKSLRGWSVETMNMETGAVRLGKAIQANNLTMSKQKTLIKEYKSGAVAARGSISELAKEQVRMQRSQVQFIKDSQGASKAIVATPTGINMKSQATLLRVANQEMKIYNRLLLQNAEATINWGKNTQWAGRQIMVGLTIPMVMFGQAAKNIFIDLDKEMTRLAKVYGGDIGTTTEAQLNEIKGQVGDLGKELSSTWGVAAKETVGLAADLAATGKEGNDLLVATKEATRLAVLGEVDRQDAMKTTLSLQNAFKLSNQELTESIDFLNAVENQTSTSLQDLTIAIPKAGPIVQSLGGDVKDLAALLVAMKEGGIDAAEGANALKSGLAAMINPTKKAKEVATGFGVDLQGIVNRNKGELLPMMIDFQKALQGLEPFARAQLIEEIFGRFQFARISALFENFGKEGSQTQQVFDLMGKSAEEFAATAEQELTRLTESTSMKWQRAVETFKNALAPIGEVVTKVFTKALDAITWLVDKFDKMPGPIKAVVLAIGGLAALVGPVLMMVGIFGNFLGQLKKGFAILRGKKGGYFEMLTSDVVAADAATQHLVDTQFDELHALKELTVELERHRQKLEAIKSGALDAYGTLGASATGAIQGAGLTDANREFLRKTQEKRGAGRILNQSPYMSAAWLDEQVRSGSGSGTQMQDLVTRLRDTSDPSAAVGRTAAGFWGHASATDLARLDQMRAARDTARRIEDPTARAAQLAQLGDQDEILAQKMINEYMQSLDQVPEAVANRVRAALEAKLLRGREDVLVHGGKHGQVMDVATSHASQITGKSVKEMIGDAAVDAAHITPATQYRKAGKNAPVPLGTLPASATLNMSDSDSDLGLARYKEMYANAHGRVLLESVEQAEDIVRRQIESDPNAAKFGAMGYSKGGKGKFVSEKILSGELSVDSLALESGQQDRLRQLAEQRAVAEADLLELAMQEKELRAQTNASLDKTNLVNKKKQFLPGAGSVSNMQLSSLGVSGAGKTSVNKAIENMLGKGIQDLGVTMKAGATNAEMLKASLQEALAQYDQLTSVTNEQSVAAKQLRDALDVLERETRQSQEATQNAVAAEERLQAKRQQVSAIDTDVGKIVGTADLDTTSFEAVVDDLDGSVQTMSRTADADRVSAETSASAASTQAKAAATSAQNVVQDTQNVAQETANVAANADAAVDQLSAGTKQVSAGGLEVAAGEIEVEAAAVELEAANIERENVSRLGQMIGASGGLGVAAPGKSGAIFLPDDPVLNSGKYKGASFNAPGKSSPIDKGPKSGFMSGVSGQSMAIGGAAFGVGMVTGNEFATKIGTVLTSLGMVSMAAGPLGDMFTRVKGKVTQFGNSLPAMLKGTKAGIGGLLGAITPATAALGGLAIAAGIAWKAWNDFKKNRDRERQVGSANLNLLGLSGTSFASRVAGGGKSFESAEEFNTKTDEVKNDENAMKFVDELNSHSRDAAKQAEQLTTKLVAMYAAAGDNKEARKNANQLIEIFASLAGFSGNLDIVKRNAEGFEGAIFDGESFQEQLDSATRAAKEFAKTSTGEMNWATGQMNTQATAVGSAIRSTFESTGRSLGTSLTDAMAMAGSDAEATLTALDLSIEVGTTFDDSAAGKTGLEEFKRSLVDANQDASEEWKQNVLNAQNFGDVIDAIINDLDSIPPSIKVKFGLDTEGEDLAGLRDWLADKIAGDAAVDKAVNDATKLITDSATVDTTDVEEAYDARIKAIEKTMKAEDKAFKKRQDQWEEEKDALQEQIDGKNEKIDGINEEIDAINEVIDKIQEEGDKRKEALEKAKEQDDFLRSMRESDIDYYDALARGDFAGAAKVRSQQDQQVRDFEHQQTIDQIDEETQAQVDKEQAKIDAKQAVIDSINEEIASIEKSIEAIDRAAEAASKAHEAARERQQEQLDWLNENRETAIENARLEQEAKVAAEKAKRDAAQATVDSELAGLKQLAEEGRLRAEDINRVARETATDIGALLGWTPQEITNYASTLEKLLIDAYGDALDTAGLSDTAYIQTPEGPKTYADYKAGQVKHSGGRIDKDHTSGRGGNRQDEVTITAQEGEFMMQRSAVNKWGEDTLHELNRGRMPEKFHRGGLIKPLGPARLGDDIGNAMAQQFAMMAVGGATKSVFPKAIEKLRADQAAASSGVSGAGGGGANAAYPSAFWGYPPSKLARMSRISAQGKSTSVHNQAAPHFQGLLNDLTKQGYKINSLGGLAVRGNTSDRGKWSQHAYGNAIDINPAQNPYGKSLITNMPSNIQSLIKKNKLYWGGNWSSIKDAMHFEWMGPAKTGKEVLKDGALAQLHNKETVLSAPLSSELKEGISKINRIPDTMGVEQGESSVVYGDTHFSITVNAQPGQDGEAIANAVFSKIRQKEARLGIRT